MLKELTDKDITAVSGGCCLSFLIPRLPHCWTPKPPSCGGGGYTPKPPGGGYTPQPPNGGYGR